KHSKLPNECARRLPNFILSRRRLEVEQRLDAATHAIIVNDPSSHSPEQRGSPATNHTDSLPRITRTDTDYSVWIRVIRGCIDPCVSYRIDPRHPWRIFVVQPCRAARDRRRWRGSRAGLKPCATASVSTFCLRLRNPASNRTNSRAA